MIDKKGLTKLMADPDRIRHVCLVGQKPDTMRSMMWILLDQHGVNVVHWNVIVRLRKNG